MDNFEFCPDKLGEIFKTTLSWTRVNWLAAVLFTQVCQTYVFIDVDVDVEFDVDVDVDIIGNSVEQHSPVAGQGSKQ